ncbi:SAF1 SCF-associated factor 1 [Candida maltosa Xu316]
MALTILDLGEDVLISEICTYLYPEEIFKFFSLSKSLYEIFQNSSNVFQILYNKKFTNNENNYTLSLQQHLNWKQLFYLRCDKNQKVYTWGSPNGGRLGYTLKDVPPAHKSTVSQCVVHTPTNVEAFNGHLIVDIVATGFAFVFLSNAGELWFSGADWKDFTGISTPGPILTRDYRANPGALALFTMANNQNANVRSRRTIPTGVPPIPLMNRRYANDDDEGDGGDDTSTTPPAGPSGGSLPQGRRRLEPQVQTEDPLIHPRPKIKETNYISRLYLPPTENNEQSDKRIVSISAGRQHIVALDDHNHIYTWDTGCKSNVGVKLDFPGLPSSALVIKVAAGWNLSAALVEGYGLVVWYTRIGITKEQFDRNEFKSEAKYFIVPFTKDDVVDFSVGCDYVIYATREDPIGADEIRERTHPMDNFNNWKASQTENIEFTTLNGCFNNFAVFTNHDQVLLGNFNHLIHREDENEEGRNPIILDELQGQNIKSVVMGDYHYLALTTDGQVLSWGVEPDSCGCLGVGYKLNLKDRYPPDVVQLEGRAVNILKPVPIKSTGEKGKWVAIAAGGWHSGGIHVPIEE